MTLILQSAIVLVVLVALYGFGLIAADMIWPKDAPDHEERGG